MKVKCFACEASIEADGTDAVVDAFRRPRAGEAHMAVSGGGDPKLRP